MPDNESVSIDLTAVDSHFDSTAVDSEGTGALILNDRENHEHSLNDESTDSSNDSIPNSLDAVAKDKSSLNKTISIDVNRTAYSHRKCFICRRKAGTRPFAVINEESILDVFIKRNILIPFNSRCCSYHLSDGKYLKENEMHNLKVYTNNYDIDKEKIEILLKNVQERDLKSGLLF